MGDLHILRRTGVGSHDSLRAMLSDSAIAAATNAPNIPWVLVRHSNKHSDDRFDDLRDCLSSAGGWVLHVRAADVGSYVDNRCGCCDPLAQSARQIGNNETSD